MSNYNLISQKILSISQNTKVFAFSISTLRAIDPSVSSLTVALANLSPLLGPYNIASVLSNQDQIIVFIKGGRSTYDLIPKSLIGAQFQTVVNFDLSYLVYNPNPTLSDLNSVVLDARFYALPVPEFKGHQIQVYGDAQIVDSNNWQTHSLALNSYGFVRVPASPDLIWNGNYTHTVNFTGNLQSLANGNNRIGAFSLIDTRNYQGEGFLLEALFGYLSNGSLSTVWHFVAKGQEHLAYMDRTAFTNWTRVSIVRQVNSINIFQNGVLIPAFANLTVGTQYYPYDIWLGAWSQVPLINSTQSAYPRPLTGNLLNSGLHLDSYRFVKETLYIGNYDYLTAY